MALEITDGQRTFTGYSPFSVNGFPAGVPDEVPPSTSREGGGLEEDK